MKSNKLKLITICQPKEEAVKKTKQSIELNVTEMGKETKHAIDASVIVIASENAVVKVATTETPAF